MEKWSKCSLDSTEMLKDSVHFVATERAVKVCTFVYDTYMRQPELPTF